jgi:hypothetical protein
VSHHHLILARRTGTALRRRAIAFASAGLGPPDFMRSTTLKSRQGIAAVTTQEGLLLWTRHRSLTSLIPASGPLYFHFLSGRTTASLCNGLSVVCFGRRSVVSWEILTLGIVPGHLVMPREPLIVAVSVGLRKYRRLALISHRPGIARRSYFEAQYDEHLTSLCQWPQSWGESSTIFDYSRLPPRVARTIASVIRGYIHP